MQRGYYLHCMRSQPPSHHLQVVVEAAGGEAAGGALEEAFTAYGVAVNSGEGLDGLATEVCNPLCPILHTPCVSACSLCTPVCSSVCSSLQHLQPHASQACKAAVVSRLEGEGKGETVTTYKLRDWVFSRQRYWGEPIPIVFPVTMEEQGADPRKGAPHTIEYSLAEAVPEAELPVELPELADFAPGDDPQGCLARCVDWRYFQKEEGGAWWARETNTMPQWAGSCWYYLRFADPTNTQATSQSHGPSPGPHLSPGPSL